MDGGFNNHVNDHYCTRGGIKGGIPGFHFLTAHTVPTSLPRDNNSSTRCKFAHYNFIHDLNEFKILGSKLYKTEITAPNNVLEENNINIYIKKNQYDLYFFKSLLCYLQENPA